LDAGDYAGAEAAFREAVRRLPSAPAGWEGLAHTAARSWAWAAALDRWRAAAQRFPSRIVPLLGIASALLELGRVDEAERAYADAVALDPNDSRPHAGLARAAMARLDWAEALRHLELAEALQPDGRIEPAPIARVLDKLQRSVEADARRLELIRRRTDPGITATADEIAIANLFLDMGRLDDADAFVRSISLANSRWPTESGTAAIVRFHLARGDVDAIVEHLDTLPPEATTPRASLQVARGHIIAGSDELAAAVIDQLPADWVGAGRDDALLVRSWLAARQGDIRSADDLYRRTIWPKRLRGYAALGSPVQGVLQPVRLPRAGQLGDEAILLFSSARDERLRIESFMDWYRALGVAWFFIVDNGSTDGTLEFLACQPDVFLFAARGGYLESAGGTRWMNDLLARFAGDHWCVVADVDEHLVFPGCDQRGLEGLVRYMDARGQTILFAPMLDMYAGCVEDQLRFDPRESRLDDVFRYFDRDLRRFGDIHPPYRTTVGGLRERLFGGACRPHLTKAPLLRAGAGIDLVSGTHVLTPGVVSDVTGVLLHYQFVGDLTSRAEFPHTNPRLRDRYAAATDRAGTLLCDGSIRFESVAQLGDLGLITSSSAFERAVQRPTARLLATRGVDALLRCSTEPRPA
jgi:tetratricopeptide (TPR) repeat protein